MTRPEAEAFAEKWAEAWNALDLERVLRHFSETVVFSSPKALEAVGSPTVLGRHALRAYWSTALAKIHRLHFRIDHIVWDRDTQVLAIIYDREVNGHRDRAVELLEFQSDGLICRGEVFYGVVPSG